MFYGPQIRDLPFNVYSVSQEWRCKKWRTEIFQVPIRRIRSRLPSPLLHFPPTRRILPVPSIIHPAVPNIMIFPRRVQLEMRYCNSLYSLKCDHPFQSMFSYGKGNPSPRRYQNTVVYAQDNGPRTRVIQAQPGSIPLSDSEPEDEHRWAVVWWAFCLTLNLTIEMWILTIEMMPLKK